MRAMRKKLQKQSFAAWNNNTNYSPEGLQLYLEQTSTQVFSCKICEIFRNTFFYRTPPVATFETKHTHASAADLLHIRIGSLDWNESYEKETKHIHASAADLLHIRIGNLDWCKC